MKNLVDIINEGKNDVIVVFEIYDKSKQLVGADMRRSSIKDLKSNDSIIYDLCEDYDISIGAQIVNALQQNKIEFPVILNLDCDKEDAPSHVNVLILNDTDAVVVNKNVLTFNDICK